MLLQNRMALVTGASRGIGAAVARRFAREGADVAITYANSAAQAEAVVAELKASGRRALAIQADAADPAAAEAAAQEAAEAFGRIDVLVNNAGVFVGAGEPVGEIPLEDFDRTMAVNVRGVFLMTQAALTHMGDGGRIITIGSSLAEKSLMPGLAAYVASKAAVVGFTRAIARDLGPRGITANVVNPGSHATDMNPVDGPSSDAQRGFMAIPRYGDTADLAGLVAWLGSAEARSVTGSAFLVDGGANA